MKTIEYDIEKCIEVLEKGGTILYPTDTIWGIGCDATNEEAVAKVYALKRRSESKSLIILVKDEDKIENYAAKPLAEIHALIQNTQKPLTIIYSNAKNLAKNCINDDGTIAMRIPNHAFCNELLTKFGKPIVSTSANISGDATAMNFDAISSEIKDSVDYIVNIEREKTSTQSSKIIKIENDEIIVIRE
jgi:L-threonylcarbamoyladenylate synthase